MLATLVIFLREGVEASMIVAILLAYLNRVGRREHFRDVFLGVGAALALATAGGVAAYETIHRYDGSRAQTIFETVTYLVAAVVLTYMTFWMRDHAPTLSAELRARTDAALDRRARWGLGLLAFQAVGREGLETMVFTLAIVFASSAHGVIMGGVAGLIVTQTQEHRQRRQEPDTVELHLYRQTFCKVEQPLLDKLARAQAALEKRLREKAWDADWKACEDHRRQAEQFLRSGQMVDACRE